MCLFRSVAKKHFSPVSIIQWLCFEAAYYLRLLLSGGFAKDLQVLELSEIKEADILIGMDIIGYGDFLFTLKREHNISRAKIYFMSPSKGLIVPPHKRSPCQS